MMGSSVAGSENASSLQQGGRSIYDFYHRRSISRRSSSKKGCPAALGSRRISVNQDILAFMEGARHERVLEELLGRSWMVYRSSPLFQSPKEDFESKSRHLEQMLSARGLHNYEAEVMGVLGLRGSLADQNAIKVSLKLRSADKVSPKPLLIAFLLGIDSKDLGLLSENASVLPVLLVAGQNAALGPFLDSLQCLFDCIISKVSFQQEELDWMFALWSGFPGSEHKENIVYLDFALPTQMNQRGIKLLQVALDADDLLGLWKSVHSTIESEFTLKEMKSFYEQLYDHLEGIYGIQFRSLKLNIFALPAVTINQNGVINIHSVQHLKSILGYLTERFQINFLTKPRIGVQADSLLD